MLCAEVPQVEIEDDAAIGQDSEDHSEIDNVSADNIADETSNNVNESSDQKKKKKKKRKLDGESEPGK